MKRNQGFTLIEIMIVVLIIGMLAAIAIPSFVRARDTARTNTCINNLRQIDQAKEMWAMEEDKSATDDAPTWAILSPYLRATTALDCPADAANVEYVYNVVGTAPACPVVGANADHVLPDN